LLFNAVCNEQVFSPNPEKKKMAQIRLVVIEKNAKNGNHGFQKSETVF